MICKLSECTYYRVVEDDDEGFYYDYYCEKCGEYLQDPFFWPFDCVAEIEDEESICANAPFSENSCKPHEGS